MLRVGTRPRGLQMFLKIAGNCYRLWRPPPLVHPKAVCYAADIGQTPTLVSPLGLIRQPGSKRVRERQKPVETRALRTSWDERDKRPPRQSETARVSPRRSGIATGVATALGCCSPAGLLLPLTRTPDSYSQPLEWSSQGDKGDAVLGSGRAANGFGPIRSLVGRERKDDPS
jgi:hypothetical protein